MRNWWSPFESGYSCEWPCCSKVLRVWFREFIETYIKSSRWFSSLWGPLEWSRIMACPSRTEMRCTRTWSTTIKDRVNEWKCYLRISLYSFWTAAMLEKLRAYSASRKEVMMWTIVRSSACFPFLRSSPATLANSRLLIDIPIFPGIAKIKATVVYLCLICFHVGLGSDSFALIADFLRTTQTLLLKRRG